MSEEPLIAVFVDFENLAIGVREMKSGQFEIQLVLKRLLEKGRIVFKRAYCDWSHYPDALKEFHGHGIEMIDIPQSRMSGKNSADIRMVVDALDLCYSKHHIDVFALVSGDSDFSPLVAKLKENNKRVIGCGAKSSTSNLLIANCDEFIYYDDLVREAEKARSARRKAAAKAPAKGNGKAETKAEAKVPAEGKSESKSDEEKRQAAIDLVLETIQALFEERGDEEKVWGSMVKQALKRRKPGFNESYHGFRTFGKLLEEAQERKLLQLEFDEKSGGYIIRSLSPTE